MTIRDGFKFGVGLIGAFVCYYAVFYILEQLLFPS